MTKEWQHHQVKYPCSENPEGSVLQGEFSFVMGVLCKKYTGPWIDGVLQPRAYPPPCYIVYTIRIRARTSEPKT